MEERGDNLAEPIVMQEDRWQTVDQQSLLRVPPTFIVTDPPGATTIACQLWKGEKHTPEEAGGRIS